MMYIELRCEAQPYIKLLSSHRSGLVCQLADRLGTELIMNSRQFIARQRVKYIWKTLKHTDRVTGASYREMEGKSDLPAWEYEKTPRIT